MTESREQATYPLEQALRAQKALRDLAGLEPEQFPLEAFVGMVSDEIETLRNQGHSDEDIAKTITANSDIQISPEQVSANYAPPEKRQHPDA